MGPRRRQKGDILPFPAPRRKTGSTFILLACCIITASTQGYDGTMMGGLNIMPQYNDYFELTTATQSLNIATIYMGGCIACFFWGWLTDQYGRRCTLFYAAVITIIAAIIQAAAQNVVMFCIARVLIGFGTTASAITCPAYLAETLPWDLRAWGLALFNDLFYVGAIAGAGVTYGTSKFEGTWAWRLPSLLQGVWGLSCLLILPWMPESPRWLIDMGRRDEALTVLARINSDGDESNDLVRLQFCEICDTICFERSPMPWRLIFKNRGSKKRLIIAATCAFFAMIQGHQLAQYQLGRVLSHAGLTNDQTKMIVNIGVNGITLVMSIFGSFYTDQFGAKSAALMSTAGLTIALFIIGVLTKFYGDTEYQPGVHATVAMIFVFSASFGFGWIPILFLVPAEMLNFSIRAWGMSMFSLVINVTGIFTNFAFPFGLEKIGWKLYVINAGWNVSIFAFIWYYWVEVKGKTLEEIDAVFDGVKHSDVPDVDMVLQGRVDSAWREKVARLTKAKCVLQSETSTV
ncbi:unnamed protein product [Discula destructiva]